MIISDLILRNAQRAPERVGLVWRENRFSWGEINTRINRLANALLRLGIRPRDRVAYLLGNSPETVETRYAIAKIGATGVPIMPEAGTREIAHIANDAGAKLLVVAADFAGSMAEIQSELETVRDAIGVGSGHGLPLDYETIMRHAAIDEPGVEVDPETICNIEYIRGTNGISKGRMITHRAVLTNTMLYLAQMPHRRDDRGTIGSPLSAGLGAYFLDAFAAAGATAHLMPDFEPARLLETIEREGITIAAATKSAFDAFTGHPDLDRVDLSSMRLFTGSSAAQRTLEGFRRMKRQPGFRADLFNGYRCPEAGGYVSYHMPTDFAEELDDPALSPRGESIGREGLFCRVDCIDDLGVPVPIGEVGKMAVQAPFVFSGYWNLPEETARAKRGDWLLTGDLARRDEDGFLYLAGPRDGIETGQIHVPVGVQDGSDSAREVLVPDGVA
jgi:fatty-acyl-CoA synthase